MDALKLLMPLCLLVFCLIMIYGFTWRIVRPLMRLLATPIYLAFFVIEGWFNVPFNVPQKGNRRLWMDFLGSLSFLLTFLTVHRLIMLFLQHTKKGTEPNIEDLIPAINTSLPITSGVVIILTIIFIMGKHTKPKNPTLTWHDKIDSLRVFKKFIEDPLTGD